MFDKQAIIEAVKEFLRVVMLAVIPVLIIGIENGVVDWKVISTVGLVAGLRFIDKLMHETGKGLSTAKGESRLVKGLTQF